MAVNNVGPKVFATDDNNDAVASSALSVRVCACVCMYVGCVARVTRSGGIVRIWRRAIQLSRNIVGVCTLFCMCVRTPSVPNPLPMTL